MSEPTVQTPRPLRAYRDDRVMDQAEFAAFLGVRLPTLRSWEQGTATPRAAMWRQIADKLGVEPRLIVFGFADARPKRPQKSASPER